LFRLARIRHTAETVVYVAYAACSGQPVPFPRSNNSFRWAAWKPPFVLCPFWTRYPLFRNSGACRSNGCLIIAVLDRPLICERKYVQPLSITWWLILFVSVHYNNDSMHGWNSSIIHIFFILLVVYIISRFWSNLSMSMQRAREIKS
jgi:hypothetical protein